MEIESIKWIDSGFSLRADIWQTLDEIKELLSENKCVHTVGYRIYEDEDWIVLVQSVNNSFNPDEDLYRGGYFIYKKNIIERTTIV